MSGPPPPAQNTIASHLLGDIVIVPIGVVCSESEMHRTMRLWLLSAPLIVAKELSIQNANMS